MLKSGAIKCSGILLFTRTLPQKLLIRSFRPFIASFFFLYIHPNFGHPSQWTRHNSFLHTSLPGTLKRKKIILYISFTFVILFLLLLPSFFESFQEL